MYNGAINKSNHDQTNLAKGGIVPRFSSSAGSINLQLHVLAGGLTPKSSFP